MPQSHISGDTDIVKFKIPVCSKIIPCMPNASMSEVLLKCHLLTLILQNPLPASGSGTVSALPTCHAKSRLLQNGPGLSLPVVCEASCWGGRGGAGPPLGMGCPCPSLASGRRARWPSPYHLPASPMGPESRFVSLSLERDEKYLHFPALQIQDFWISSFPFNPWLRTG